jgi:drug/metabolite transporter (DMT)-like permease
LPSVALPLGGSSATSTARTGLMLDRFGPLAFVLLWSSSFVSTRAALNYASPLAFITLRLALCALVLLAVMAASRRRFAGLAGKWQHCAIAGALINGLMLASSHWGIVRTGAAPLALVQTLNPILTALLAGPLLGEWLRLRQWLGLALGAAGVGLVVGMAAFGNSKQLDGLAVAGGGVLALTMGTLYYARFCRDVPLLPGTTVQFVSAAVVCAVLTFLFETPDVTWNGAVVVGLMWNAGAVSFGGMAFYFVMLARGTAARTTSNFYLVPGVTALMAWVFLGEGLSLLAVAGLVTASIGCFLVSAPRRVGAMPSANSAPAAHLASHHAADGGQPGFKAADRQPAPSRGQFRDA